MSELGYEEVQGHVFAEGVVGMRQHLQGFTCSIQLSKGAGGEGSGPGRGKEVQNRGRDGNGEKNVMASGVDWRQ